MLDNICFVRHVAFNQGEDIPNETGFIQLEKLHNKIHNRKLDFNKIISSSGPLSIFTAKNIIESNNFNNQLYVNDLYLKKKVEIKDFSKILLGLQEIKQDTLIVTNGEFIFNFLEFLHDKKIIRNNPITLARGECYFVEFKEGEAILEIY